MAGSGQVPVAVDSMIALAQRATTWAICAMDDGLKSDRDWRLADA
jgi:hypothetical protein